MILCQQLKAPNDRNGNPRRVWLIHRVNFADRCSNTIKIIDEGYSGVPEECANLPTLPPIAISASEYREWLALEKVAKHLEQSTSATVSA